MTTYALALWLSILSGADHAATDYQMQCLEGAVQSFAEGNLSATEENLMDLEADLTDGELDQSEGEQQ
jgi:hypothetical protein